MAFRSSALKLYQRKNRESHGLKHFSYGTAFIIDECLQFTPAPIGKGNNLRSMMLLLHQFFSALVQISHSSPSFIEDMPPSFILPMHILHMPSLQHLHSPDLQHSPHFPSLQHSHFSQHGIFIPMLDCDPPCVLAQAATKTRSMTGIIFLNMAASFLGVRWNTSPAALTLTCQPFPNLPPA